MDIKIYDYDDTELLKKIVHLLGNVDWKKEHDQMLTRNPTKKFYLLEDSGKMISMFSLNKKVLGDFHTEPEYRGKGYFKKLLESQNFKEGTYAMTRNNYVIELLYKNGFECVGLNGRFHKMAKTGASE